MKINKEIRQLSRKMLRASFTDGQLDPGRIASLVDSLIAEKPRNYIDVAKKLQTFASARSGKAPRHESKPRAKWIPQYASEIVANLKKQIRQRPHDGVSR